MLQDSSLLYVYDRSMAQDGRPEASRGQGRCSRDSTHRLRPNIDALPITFARKRPRRGPREPPPTIRRSRRESTSRLAVRPTAHAVTWRCMSMVRKKESREGEEGEDGSASILGRSLRVLSLLHLPWPHGASGRPSWAIALTCGSVLNNHVPMTHATSH